MVKVEDLWVTNWTKMLGLTRFSMEKVELRGSKMLFSITVMVKVKRRLSQLIYKKDK